VTDTTFTNDFSKELWGSTYRYKNEESVDETMQRVAKAIASVEATESKKEEWSEKFYEMLSGFNCTLGGRIYANAGTNYTGTTLLNCYVGPEIEKEKDSLKGILEVLGHQAQTLKSEGGCGYNFSFIRPRGSMIHGIGVETPGAIRYMELFDKASDIITSGSGVSKSKDTNKKGKIRKGAMMGVLDCWHPDVMEFIRAKQTQGRLSKFNISVNCTDEFMEKVISDDPDEEWTFIFPDHRHEDYDTIWKGDIKDWKERGLPVVEHETVKVKWLWDLIMESNYNRAEPGVLFLDRANALNESNYISTIYATNPCGEQTLPPSGVCDLGSLNLAKCVNSDLTGFDYDKVEKYARYLVRCLDNVNSLTLAPLSQYKDFAENSRRIGVGVLGWASSLYLMKITFGSDKAAKLRDSVMKFISHTVVDESINLAEEKGMFKWCDPEKHANAVWFKQIGLPEDQIKRIKDVGIRNSALMSIQPTGNTSIFANIVSGGIEPIFAQEYLRTSIVQEVPEHLKGKVPKYWESDYSPNAWFKEHKEGDEDMLKYEDEYGVTYKIDKSRGLTKETLCEDFAVNYLKKVGEWDSDAEWAVTAMSLPAKVHVDDLKGFAKYVDSAISKTINVPFDYPYEDFKNLYTDAYKTGYIKGLTTYRSGTMTAVLSEKEDKKSKSLDDEVVTPTGVKLPDEFDAKGKTLKAEGKKWYVMTHHLEDGSPFAIFAKTNCKESSAQTGDAVQRLESLARRKGILGEHVDKVIDKISSNNNVDKLARIISLNLRHGVKPLSIVAELDKMDEIYVGSFLFQIKKFLSNYIHDGESVVDSVCNSCGSSKVVYSEGCMKCMDCGSSKCG
jgi:ribonucleoside-diphosphate reductase alpha chain